MTTIHEQATDATERLVSDEQLDAARIPVTRVGLATIGGGLGSFALVDRLRVAGVPAEEIAVLGDHTAPGAAFLARCTALGMTDESRLRSESTARIDNLWGFPGYSSQEARRTRSLRPLTRHLLEGVAGEGSGPTVGTVRAALDKEARRIGWHRMTSGIPAAYVFKRTDGGYFVVCRKKGGLVAVRCDHVHLALGSPGPRSSPEVATFRSEFPASTRLTTAYDDNASILRQLSNRGANVVVRGAGPAAVQLLEQLAAGRVRHGRELHIWHVMRTWPDGTSGREEGLGFRHQALDFPRSAYSGALRDELRRADEDARLAAFERLGASTTPRRAEVDTLLEQARAAGWYDAVVGEVESFTDAESRISTRVLLQNGERMTIEADHVFDATGLEPDSAQHPLIADLLAFSPVSTNRLGGLRTAPDWTIDGGASGDGLMFASGRTARGGHYGPVDSFVGLQQAALSIADTLAASGFGERLGPLRSARGWLQWIGGKSL